MNIPRRPALLFLAMFTVNTIGPQLFAQASNLRVNNEKPEQGGQSKRIHPHGLKLILQGKKKEAIAYLNKYKDDNPKAPDFRIYKQKDQDQGGSKSSDKVVEEVEEVEEVDLI